MRNILMLSIYLVEVLKQCLNMVAPDVEVDDGRGIILISSEEGDTEGS